LQKLHDLARQKETLAGSLLLFIIGIAGSGCRGTVRRLVGGGFSTAGRPGEVITQPVAALIRYPKFSLPCQFRRQENEKY